MDPGVIDNLIEAEVINIPDAIEDDIAEKFKVIQAWEEKNVNTVSSTYSKSA